jgi:hypothetical protein
VLNVCLFMAALVISIMRYTIWPEIWTVMIHVGQTDGCKDK